MKHLVNKLILEITCGSEDDAFSLQHNLAPLLQQQVAEAIEKASQGRNDSSDLVIIDRIEIDLGTISFQVQEQVLATAIQHEVEGQLKPYLQAKQEDDKNKRRQENSTALFHYFMMTGNLPWWAQTTAPDISDVFMELIDNRFDETVGFLYKNRASSIFWQRIVYQFNTEAKKKLADSVQNIKQGLGLLLDTLQQQESTTGSSFLEEQRLIGEKKILDMLLLDAPLIFSEESANNLSGTVTKIIKKNLQLPGMENLLQELIKWKPESVESLGDNQDSSLTLVENDFTEQERYFISHSGIIILAPYLKMFFNRLLLLEDEQWKNSLACFKAVQLLRYLACGETVIAEYQLSLEKIICGLSPLAPVPADVGLEPHELDEADSLLQSVVENWKKLGNTSIYGLRESFLNGMALLHETKITGYCKWNEKH